MLAVPKHEPDPKMELPVLHFMMQSAQHYPQKLKKINKYINKLKKSEQNVYFKKCAFKIKVSKRCNKKM